MPRIDCRLVRGLSAASGALLVAVASFWSATAQDAHFYKDKQIRMIIGHPVGGDYDQGGRLLARYLTKHIPGNPVIVVQNMPAAASLVAANYLYSQAPQDGTVFGSFSRNVPSQAVLGQANLDADARRFQWLGSTSLPSRVCVTSSASKIKRPGDLFEHEMITAGAGAGSSLSIVPTVLNEVLGTKFKVVEGYKGAPEALLAIERGEVEGVCNSWAQFRSHQKLFDDGKLNVLFHAEEGSVQTLPNVPSIFQFAKTAEQRQLMRFIFSSVEFGRPYVLPPNVPKERVEIMRAAFLAAVNDRELITEAEKMNLDMTFRTADYLSELVDQLYATPPALIEKAKQLVADAR